MATEKILIFDEAGNAKRMKVRIARFLDNEPVTASDKENIRTTLDVDDSLSGTFTTPLSVTSASDSSFTGGGNLNVTGGKTTLTNDSDNALVVETTNQNPMIVNVVGSAPNYLFDVRDDDTSKFRVDGSGRVSVGATGGAIAAADDDAGLVLQQSVGGVAELSRATDTDGHVVGKVNFANRNNSNTVNPGSANYPAVAGIEAQLETSDSNAHDDSGGHLVFKTKPEAGLIAERWRINSSGNLVANSTGIDFGSTTTGTGTPTGGLLSDYEEGDWTPSPSTGSITGTGLTYVGKYTKIGRMVQIYIRVNATAHDINVASYVGFSGVPFTMNTNASGTVVGEDIDQSAQQGFASISGGTLFFGACGNSSALGLTATLTGYI